MSGGVETFVLVDMSNPGAPMCADRNPYTDKTAPEPPEEDIGEYNSASHYNKGQNVLYKDGHVKFETRASIGVSDDNIYTYRESDTDDPAAGTAPNGDGDPAAFSWTEDDALLISERNGRSG
jgi:hypothetical protein